MTLKIFASPSLNDVEQAVNKWLAQSLGRVCHVTKSQSEKQGRFVFVVSIWFEQPE